MTAATTNTRAARAWRGSAAAFFATLCAAASHALAGGQLTWLALIATTVVAMPVCVALAGRLGSFWRITVAVCFSQALYHLSFSGLGALSGQTVMTTNSEPASAHAHHAHAEVFTPLASAGHSFTVDGMWIAHAIAAVCTIALLSSGERTLLNLGRAIQRKFRSRYAQVSVLEQPAPARIFARVTSSASLFSGVSSITHRGPPRAAHPAIRFAHSAASHLTKPRY